MIPGRQDVGRETGGVACLANPVGLRPWPRSDIATPQFEAWRSFIDGADTQDSRLASTLDSVFPLRVSRALSIELVSHHLESACERRDTPHGHQTQAAVLALEVRLAGVPGQLSNLVPPTRKIRLRIPAVTPSGSFVIDGQPYLFVNERRLAPGVVALPSLGRAMVPTQSEPARSRAGHTRSVVRITPSTGRPVSIRTTLDGLVEVRFGFASWINAATLLRVMGAHSQRDLLHMFCGERTLLGTVDANTSDDILARPVDLPGVNGGEIFAAGSLISAREIRQLRQLGVPNWVVYRWRRRTALHDEPEYIPAVVADQVIDPRTGEVLISTGSTLDGPRRVDLLARGAWFVDLDRGSSPRLIRWLLRTWRRQKRKTLDDVFAEVGSALEGPGSSASAIRDTVDMALSPPGFSLEGGGRERFARTMSRPVSGSAELTREDLCAAIAGLLEMEVGLRGWGDSAHVSNFAVHSTASLISEVLADAFAPAHGAAMRGFRRDEPLEGFNGWCNEFAFHFNAVVADRIANRCAWRRRGALSFPIGAPWAVEAVDDELSSAAPIQKLFRTPHPSWYSRLCVVDGPTTAQTGLVTTLAKYARIGADGALLSPALEHGSDAPAWRSPASPSRDQTNASAVGVKVIAPEQGNKAEEAIQAQDAFEDQSLSANAASIPFALHSHWQWIQRGAQALDDAAELTDPELPTVFTANDSRDTPLVTANLLTAYTWWNGLTSPNTVVVSDALVEKGSLRAAVGGSWEIPLAQLRDPYALCLYIVSLRAPTVDHPSRDALDAAGIVRVGARIAPGGVLVSRAARQARTPTAREKLLAEILALNWTGDDRSILAPLGMAGVVTDLRVQVRSEANAQSFLDSIGEAVRRSRLRETTGNLDDRTPLDSRPMRHSWGRGLCIQKPVGI